MDLKRFNKNRFEVEMIERVSDFGQELKMCRHCNEQHMKGRQRSVEIRKTHEISEIDRWFYTHEKGLSGYWSGRWE